MSGAEDALYRRWSQQTGVNAPGDDLIGQLLSHGVAPENGDRALWLLGLGEKVAALGGRLEVRAVFDTDEVTLVVEPGSDGQPPILGDRAELSELTAVERYELSAGDPDAPLEIELTAEERGMILTGLLEWGGAAHPSDALAVAMGFLDREDLWSECERLTDAVQHGRSLNAFDWKRLLISTEIAFGSDYFGIGTEWETVAGGEDWPSLLVLRGLQDKLIGIANRAKRPTRRTSADPTDGTSSD